MGSMDWHRWVEQNREALERMLALLVALAVLADRASALPAPGRLHVLAILHRGEVEARLFLMGIAHQSGEPASAEAAAATVAPDCARRLAASLRMLALVLGAMLAEARRLSTQLTGAGALAGFPVPACRRVEPEAPPAPRAPDTS